jgi:hypothetical protein
LQESAGRLTKDTRAVCLLGADIKPDEKRAVNTTEETSSKDGISGPGRWWYLYVGVALAALSLGLTAEQVFDARTQEFFATNADSIAIAERAMAAQWSDIGKWWRGPWIQHEMYYRPLSSMLFFAEGQLFGMDFQRYCIVSWVANAANVVLLFLLGSSLARGSRKVRLVIGGLTGLLFLLARHPEICQGIGNPTAPAARVTWSVMPWWPVQTDIFSMLFGVLSLLLLDRYLVVAGTNPYHASAHNGPVSLRSAGPSERPTALPSSDTDCRQQVLVGRMNWYLAGALVSFVTALLFKEMALCLPLLVPLLVLYRRRDKVLGVSALYFGLAGVFYVVRTLASPGASGLEYQGARSLMKLAFYAVNQLSALVLTDEWFPVLGSLGLLVIVLVMVWKRVEWVWTGLAALLWLLAAGQLFGGNFAMFSLLEPMVKLVQVGILWGGVLLLVLVRDRGVSAALVVAVIAVCVPVVNRIGTHYWYWPLAFYALLNASLLNRLYEVVLQSDTFGLIVRYKSMSRP